MKVGGPEGWRLSAGRRSAVTTALFGRTSQAGERETPSLGDLRYCRSLIKDALCLYRSQRSCPQELDNGDANRADMPEI